MEPARKILLDVVIFEVEGDEDGSRKRFTRQRSDETPKELKYKTVIRSMLLDVNYVSSLSIRKWENRVEGQASKWSALFDKVKGGEITIIAKPLDELRALFEKHNIIKVLT